MISAGERAILTFGIAEETNKHSEANMTIEVDMQLPLPRSQGALHTLVEADNVELNP